MAANENDTNKFIPHRHLRAGLLCVLTERSGGQTDPHACAIADSYLGTQRYFGLLQQWQRWNRNFFAIQCAIRPWRSRFLDLNLVTGVCCLAWQRQQRFAACE
ncbi:MAG TPA: hypothetical protein VIW21_10725 [Chthoniobacterales bacterium]